MFTAAFRCDNCENHLQASQGEFDPEDIGEFTDPLPEAGWFTVVLPTDNEIHVCSEKCLTVWAASRAVAEHTIEL